MGRLLFLLFIILSLLTPKLVRAQTINPDVNRDGKVDIIDIGIVIENYNRIPILNSNADINRDGIVNILDIGIIIDNYNRIVPTPTRSPSPTPTRSPSPTPTRSPSPSPINTTSPVPTANPQIPSGQWGIYPNCIPPAMPVEAQTWWIEKENPKPGDEIPFGRHIHGAACMPHARDAAGRLVNVSGRFDFVRLLLLHNTNLALTKADNGFPEVGSGPEFVVRFNPAKTCPNRGINCTFYSSNTIDTTVAPDGLHELRWRVEGSHPDLSNKDEFISFATKIYIKNGHSINSSASNSNPRGRGWYHDVDYDSAEISNYNDLYRGRTDISVPIVSGQVNLQMNHNQSSGCCIRSRLYMDPNFHAGIAGTILYDKPGLFQGTYALDTTRFPNGRHVLVVQTEHTVASGIHSGLLKLFIDINN